MIVPIEIFTNAYLCISDPKAEAFARFVGVHSLISGYARRAATVNRNRDLDFYRAAARLVGVLKKVPAFVPKGSATCGNVVPTRDYDIFCSGTLSDVLYHIFQCMRHSWDPKGFCFLANNLISFIFEDGSIDIHMGGMTKPLESLPEERERLTMILCNRGMSRFHPVVQAYLSLQGLTFIPNDVYKSLFIKENPTLFQILWFLSGSNHALPTFFLAVIVRISLTYGQNVVAEIINRMRERHGDAVAIKEFVPVKAREAIVFDAALQAAVALLIRTWGVWYKYRGAANDAQAHYLRTGIFQPFVEDGAYCKGFDAEMLDTFFERMRLVAKFGPYFADVHSFEGLFLKMLTQYQLERFLKSRFDLPELLASVVNPKLIVCPSKENYAVFGMNTPTTTIFAAALAYSGLPDITCIRKMLACDPKDRLQQIMHLPQLVCVSLYANTSRCLPVDPRTLFGSDGVLMLSPMLSPPSLKHWPTAEDLKTLGYVFDFYWDYSWMFRRVEPIVYTTPRDGADAEYVPVVSVVAPRKDDDDKTKRFKLSYLRMEAYTAEEHCSNLVWWFQGAAIAEIVYGKGWNDEREIWALCAQVRAWMDAATADHRSVATTAACSEAGETEDAEVKSP